MSSTAKARVAVVGGAAVVGARHAAKLARHAHAVRRAAAGRWAAAAASDVELPLLAAYLAHIATSPKGCAGFDHAKWRAEARAALGPAPP